MSAPLLQAFRPMRMKTVAVVDKWSLTNLALQVIFDLLVFSTIGLRGLCYLLLSNIFALGLNPLGARWVQEHFRLVPDQETFSYYGWVNRLVFNAGYHVEHHDMMRIPWMRLPELREAAPEFYQNLHSYRSWTTLLFRFLLDPRIDLNRRVP
jgi:sphingolipid delta-4 desaturase